jgi:hypothetical protein
MITGTGCIFCGQFYGIKTYEPGRIDTTPQDHQRQTTPALVGIEKLMVSKTSPAAVPDLNF